MKLLSILICTLPSRKEMFESLLSEIQKQIFVSKYKSKVEIWHDDSIEMTTGMKRNHLLKMAQGKFSVFIDDDDMVSEDYISKIISCIESNIEVDCIGIKGQIITNGSDIKEWEISMSFGKWFEANNKYYRTPNHISPIRTEHCLKTMFPNITIGEDSDFSQRILPLLKKEAKVDGNIYFYRYTNNQIVHQNTHEFPYRPAFR
jgi:hypothetical protein